MRLTNDEIFERAFFPRMLWAITDAAFMPDDKEGRELVKEFHADMDFWLNKAYNKTQFHECKIAMDYTANGLIEHLIDKKAGTMRTTKITMVVFGLCLLASERKEGLFTERFEAAINRLNDHLQDEAADEMAEVERSAQKSLSRALSWLHGRFKFKWIEV